MGVDLKTKHQKDWSNAINYSRFCHQYNWRDLRHTWSFKKNENLQFSNKIYMHPNYEDNGNDFNVGFANHLVEIQVERSRCT
jgi:hypothetical protein